MKIETLKRSHLKRNIMILIIIIIIISTIIFTFTRAKYRSKYSIPLIESIINYKVSDFKLVSIYSKEEGGEYQNIDSIPKTGYILNTDNSYCEILDETGNSIKDESVELLYENGSMTFSNVTKKGTKCYLYFDEFIMTIRDQILQNYPTQLIRTDFDEIIMNATSSTIYYADTNQGRTYYFAGAPTDNWVYFAGFYWRIIRINEDGSLRIIYNGTNPNQTGEDLQIGTSNFNDEYNDNAYVGYMYGTPGGLTYAETHANINDSTIKVVLDEWYEKNLLNYAEYISTEAGFCGDRTPSTSEETSNGLGGTGTIQTYYGAYIRLITNSSPSYECNDNDLFTVSSSSKGNKALDYPIGLITADEVKYAGSGRSSANNNKYFLYTGNNYWTMTPSWLLLSRSAAGFFVYNSGMLGGSGPYMVANPYGVRPVINLEAHTIISGSGTTSDPYIVS